MGYTLFVSHSSQDFELVRAIQDAARPLGISVYTYEQDLQPGDNLPEKLLQRIGSADAMIVLLTHYGAVSPAVHQEIGAAKQANRLVIPIVDQGIDLERFPLLQGTECLVLNRANPAETLEGLTGRLSRLKGTADLSKLVLLLILSALAVWASRSE